MIRDAISVMLIFAGCGFFLAGTVGLLRFPDVFTRLHALTKADSLGLGLVVLGLLPQSQGLGGVVKLLAVWMMALLITAAVAHLVGRSALDTGHRPWRAE